MKILIQLIVLSTLALLSQRSQAVSVNLPPTISNIPDATVCVNTLAGPFPFVVGDPDDPATNLVVTAVSSNTALVPTANIILGGFGANRTITLNPVLNQSGQSTITVRVVDPHGASSADTFVLTVGDNVNPTINCLADIVASADPGQCFASGVVLGTPVASDNCGVASVTGKRSDALPLTDPYPVGTTTVIWTATDNAGNIATCNQTVTVNDTEPPVLTRVGPDPLIVACGDTAFTDPGATAIDNCSGTLMVAVSGQVDVNTPGDYTRTYSAQDSSGNSASLTRIVRVACGNSPLAITCPPDMVVGNDQGQCSAVVDYPAPSAAGNGVIVICNPPSGSVFPAGTTTVACSATDAAGNSATCSFNVTVNDTEPPVASCAVVKAPALFTNPVRIAGWFQLLATDNCDPDPLIYIKSSASSFVAGPFHNGDQVEIAHARGLIPRQAPSTFGGNIATIQLNGDVLLWAVDSSGNASTPVKCK